MLNAVSETKSRARIARDGQIKCVESIAKAPSIRPLTLRHRRQHTLRITIHTRDIRHGTT